MPKVQVGSFKNLGSLSLSLGGAGGSYRFGDSLSLDAAATCAVS